MSNHFIKNKHTQRGVTLIELLVSLTIFSIVMVISMGALIVLMDANAKAQKFEIAMSNLSFATDLMTRKIRTGYSYYCDGDVDSIFVNLTATQDCGGVSQFAYVDGRTGSRVGYRLTGGVIQMKDSSPGASNTWLSITSPEITINTLEFTVVGTARYTDPGANTAQPTVQVFIAGTVDTGDEFETQFKLQSKITQRTLDL